MRPHVAEWWSPTPSLTEVEQEFRPLIIGESTTLAYHVLGDGVPMGYIQSYVAKDSGDGWWPDEQDPGVRGIDQREIETPDGAALLMVCDRAGFLEGASAKP